MAMLLCIPLVLLTLFPVSLGFDGYDFVLKTDPNTPRVLLTKPGGVRFSELPKTEFTFCLYAYLKNTNGEDAILVSYSSEETGSDNELYLEIYLGRNAYTSLSINGKAAIFNKIPILNDWTHICLSWSSKSGDVHLFLNGKEIQGDGTKIQLGKTVGGNGYFVLGQDQDSFNGGYDATQGFKGRVTQFNLWDRELSRTEVKEVMSNTRSGEVIAWSNSTWTFSGGIMLEKTTAPIYTECGEVKKPPCQHVKSTNIAPYDLESGFEDGYPREVTGTLKNVVVPDMKELSYCFVIYNKLEGYVLEPVTYTAPDGESVFTFGSATSPQVLYFRIGNQKAEQVNSDIAANRNVMYCVTWSSATGKLTFYSKGRAALLYNNISRNYVVPGNGKLIITQGQYAPLNKENPTEGFVYKASDFYLWPRLLTEEEVASFYRCTGSVRGYLVDPSNSEWEVKDHRCPSHSEVSPIESVTESEFTNNVKKKIGMSMIINAYSQIKQLEKLTACFWVYAKEENPTIGLFITADKARISLRNGLEFIYGTDIATFSHYVIGADSWQHVCVTWTGVDGTVQLFVDAEQVGLVGNIAVGKFIPKNAMWKIDNVQYAPADTKDPKEGFDWKVTQLDVWDYVLSTKEIIRAFECSLVVGNAISSKTSSWKRKLWE